MSAPGLASSGRLRLQRLVQSQIFQRQLVAGIQVQHGQRTLVRLFHLHAGAEVGGEHWQVVGDNYPGRRIDSTDLLPVLTRCLT